MLPHVIIKNYPAEQYKVIFDKKSGFLARIEDKGCKNPFWAPSGPELLDISITNWCDKGCTICYRNSNINGSHMSLMDYEYVMKEASKHNVFQVALGGGNPNQHPEFEEILKLTRTKYDIVPSYTTNGRGLTEAILVATEKYCGAVAVSAHKSYSELDKILSKMYRYNIKVNVHFVLDVDSIETAIHWLGNKSSLDRCNALIFLNYKPVGANKDNSRLLRHSNTLSRLFELIENNKRKYKIGFDSCMVSGILKHMKEINNCFIEPCDAGRFSAFISEDLRMYPCSFMVESYRGESLRDNNFIDIWLSSHPFTKTRSHLNGKKCECCSDQEKCLNGCPFLEDINLC